MVNVSIEGEIPLDYDKQALNRYLESIKKLKIQFQTTLEKITSLINNDHIEKDLIDNYTDFKKSGLEFISDFFDKAYFYNFKFKSFMADYKFYNQYVMKTIDDKYYLESFEDRVSWNGLYLANGNKILAVHLLEEMINQRYQPATPTFLNLGKNRGEMVSCFLIDLEDSILSIGRGINSVL